MRNFYLDLSLSFLNVYMCVAPGGLGALSHFFWNLILSSGNGVSIWLTILVKFPTYLCSISTRQLELLLWRTGPTVQHLQDYLIFSIQMNYVNKIK